MPKIFEVKYEFKCPLPECLQQNAHLITITAEAASDARELALAGLACGYCHKELPKDYFVHTVVAEMRSR